MVCEIKDCLKPILKFYIPGGNRRRWIGNSWNMMALWKIRKYQVHTWHCRNRSLVASAFVTWKYIYKNHDKKIKECTHSILTPFWLNVHQLHSNTLEMKIFNSSYNGLRMPVSPPRTCYSEKFLVHSPTWPSCSSANVTTKIPWLNCLYEKSRLVPLDWVGALDPETYVGLGAGGLLYFGSERGFIFFFPLLLVFSKEFWSFAISFWAAFSSASFTLSALFLSYARRHEMAFALMCSSSMPCKSTISTPDSPTASLDFFSSISKAGVKLGAQSRYHPPPVRCEVDHVRCWFAENMHVEFDMSSYVERIIGRSLFVLLLLQGARTWNTCM